jgi:3-oxoacyl-(acyl-carrier-protein) synthase/pimeloyl-ACP methyl ester carboxylesterase/NAD(P)-dependent dehydrogenase (short-subunit alcohol dehydrogenase family)/acyl carrier protein
MTTQTVLVVGGDEATRDALAAQVAARGGRCVRVAAGAGYERLDEDAHRVEPGSREDHERLIRDLSDRAALPDVVLHLLTEEPGGFDPSRLAADLDLALYGVLWTAAAVLGRAAGTRLRVVVHAAAAGRPAHPVHGAVAGLLRSLALEHSGLRAASVRSEPGGETPAELAGRLLAEADRLGGDGGPDADHMARTPEVVYRDGVRLRRRLERFEPARGGDVEALRLRPDGTYLIAGGAGGLGLRFAAFLARHGDVNVVLAGRSEPDAGTRARIEALSCDGVSVAYRQADVRRRSDVEALVGWVHEHHGPLHGVVHAAGVIRDGLAVRKTRADVEAVVGPKVLGAVHLDEATVGEPLDFVALFSSVAAETGNLGQADYAFAGAFLNGFAAWREDLRRAGRRAGRTVSIGWPLWRDGGMTVEPGVRRLFERRWGMVPLDTDAGLRAFCRALAGPEPALVVVGGAGDENGPAPAPAPPAAPAPDGAGVRQAVEAELRRAASGFLLVDEPEVDVEASLMDLGFDSISLTMLVNDVNDRHGLDLLPTVLFEAPTLAAFADYLLANHGDAFAADRAEPEPAGGGGSEGPPPAPPDGAVAIVGMACVMPQADDPETFWRHLAAGHDLVGRVPEDRVELRADPATAGVRGGFLSDVRSFDAALFNISPGEAALMDPQQRLFLETARRAIENAGYRPSALAGTATGVFAGVSACDYDDLLRQHGVPVAAHTASGVASCILVNRVSHVLDLRGPSEAVDTACSSSLVAIHRAVRAISAGECQAALAGGVNVLLSPGLFVAFQQSGMLSPDGTCKAFDERADGYGRGEGCGVVMLKPLATALADGDHVHAVIRGSAVNHGGRAASLTAPNPEAQAAVLVAAHRAAGVDPATVTCIEAHGTGTRLGDPVEVEGMRKAFATLFADHGRPLPDQPRIAIGSVKTNVGHLEAAGGIAGLLKVVLAMRHGELPASLHFSRPSGYLRLDGTPFFVNDRTRRWDGVAGPGGEVVRRAGVSSFGFGGSNAHVVLEGRDEPPSPPPPEHPWSSLLVLSAPTAAALAAYAGRMARFLNEHPEAGLERVACTLALGREPLAERLAVVAGDRAHAAGLLEAAAGGAGRVDGLYRGTASADASPAGAVRAPAEVAAAWVSGARVDWDLLWAGPRPRRLSLPSFPMARTVHWFDAGRAAPAPARARSTRPPVRLRARGGEAPRPAAAAAEPAPDRADGDAAGTICSLLSGILGVSPSDVPSDRPFAELGLDSIFRMELVQRLNARCGLALEAAQLYDHDSVEQLARFMEPMLGAHRAEPSPPAAGGPGAVEDLLARLVSDAAGRPLDRSLSFVGNGLTSFDMLRVVSALDGRLGPQRKTLLFDHPTVPELAAHLVGLHGERAGELLADVPRARPGPIDRSRPPAAAGEPLVLPREGVDQVPELRAALADLDERCAAQGGLAGRECSMISAVAPLVFLSSRRDGYLSFSSRGRDLLAWSYVGADERFAALLEEWVSHARREGLRPNLLSLARIDEVAGEPFTATPFGALQRLTDLGGFTLAGRPMSRLRYMVGRFEKAGHSRTVEYRSGDDPAVDAEIAGVLDRWGRGKPMVNPYMEVVREEIRSGQLDRAYRIFLTYLDGALANAMVLTRIPGVAGYLLALEFYPEDMPLGGLEWAITRVIDTLAAEGCTTLSFGASFGVKVCDSPNPAADVVAALDELQSAGIFGAGNFQFKNKFRPANLPVYLCQPAGDHTPAADVILAIASPDRPRPVAHEQDVLALPHRAVPFDLLTDSWAERDDPFVRRRMRELADRAADLPAGIDVVEADWLPFARVVPVRSGRSAEARLCRSWPGPHGVVLHNGLFPTWRLALADAGFEPVALGAGRRGGPFPGDVDTAELARAVSAHRERASFVCVELCSNALGGYAASLTNLREVRAIAREHGLPLVLDASRLLENAAAIAAAEDGERGADLWDVARRVLQLADAATLSLSKDFGIAFGGLLATNDPALADHVLEDLAIRGQDVNLSGRTQIAAVLRDRAAVAEQVRRRMEAVRTLWRALADAGVPVVRPEPQGHCVLLDVAGMPRFAGLDRPVESCLAWIHRATGVRGGPHLAGGPGADLRTCIRLAVPVGLTAEDAATVAARLAALFRDRGAADRPAATPAPAEAARPPDENLRVLREHNPAVERVMVRLAGGEVEAFSAGAGPPLVLVHPFNIGAGAFAYQFAGLAGRHRVIAVHAPGVGATGDHDDLTLEGIARLHREVLDQLGVEWPVHLAGASFGGLAAAQFVLSYPRHCASLTLLASSHRVGNKPGDVDRLEVVARADFDRVARHLDDDRDRLEALLLRCESMDPRTGLRYLDVFAAHPDLLGRLGEIAVPALVVHGRLDSVIPLKTAHLLHGAIPRARYEELGQAGHFPWLTSADAVNGLLLDFLSDPVAHVDEAP